MDYLNTRKRLLEQERKLGLSAAMLKKLTDQAPGAIFQYKMSPDGTTSFPFLSKGIEELHPGLNPVEFKEDPRTGFKTIHPEDLKVLLQNLEISRSQLKNWDMEYRVLAENFEDEKWHWVNAKPEKLEDGSVVWHGIFQDITQRKEYIKALEQILFDISHVMRRPVSTLLGLVNAIEAANPDKEMLKQFTQYIKETTQELDEYIRQLNKDYSNIKLKLNSQETVQTSAKKVQ